MLDRRLIVSTDDSIRSALKKLDLSGLKLLVVCDREDTLLGVATDGDLRRAILSGASLDEPILSFYSQHPTVFIEGNFSEVEARNLFLERRLEAVPILDSDGGRVIDVITWDDLFSEKRKSKHLGTAIDAQVVIMAGGKGTRMAPFTTVLPKPLIPIGEKTILEIIIGEFRNFDIKDFFVTLNYRGEIIKAYFDTLPEKDYTLSYIWEDEFLGTAGSLRYLRDTLRGTFIVSNCDIIVKADFADVIRFHKSSGAAITVISSIQNLVVPYGVIDFGCGGNVTGIREKPEFAFPINTGVYVLEPICLEQIPEKTLFHMTDLIEKLLANGQKVVTYPVNEKEYLDIGQWDEYHKVLELMHS